MNNFSEKNLSSENDSTGFDELFRDTEHDYSDVNNNPVNSDDSSVNSGDNLVGGVNENDDVLDNDKVIDVQDNKGLIEQDDAVLNWEVFGLYKDDGKVFSARHLKKNPPILNVKDSTGAEVNFILTRNLSEQLKYVTESVYKAYFNIQPKSFGEDNTDSLIKKWLPLVAIMILIALIYVFSAVL